MVRPCGVPGASMLAVWNREPTSCRVLQSEVSAPANGDLCAHDDASDLVSDVPGDASEKGPGG